MPDTHAKDAHTPLDVQPQAKERERRSQARIEGVLSQIENATYAIIRKHEKQSA